MAHAMVKCQLRHRYERSHLPSQVPQSFEHCHYESSTMQSNEKANEIATRHEIDTQLIWLILLINHGLNSFNHFLFRSKMTFNLLSLPN